VGALDSLKLAPDRGRFPTLREEADQVARLTFQPKDFGLQVLYPTTPFPEGGFDMRVNRFGC